MLDHNRNSMSRNIREIKPRVNTTPPRGPVPIRNTRYQENRANEISSENVRLHNQIVKIVSPYASPKGKV